jgi:exosortase D (VPLPA-CTERM-specific)
VSSISDFIKGTWFKVSLLLVLFIAAYWVPLSSLVNTWMKNEDYSYGFLIPVVSLYLIWDMRARLKDVEFRSSWAVFPVLISLVLLSIYGILGSSGNISMPAVPLLIICFTAFCFGLDITRRLILPLGFLIFMVPIPPILERTIGIYLKSLSSKLGGEVIQFFNISVNVSGNIIDLGVTQLQVVDACNGLRYVFPLLAIGVIYAYLFERVTWKRIFCVLITIPIAILTNALRIGITGILTNYYGPGVAEGFFHDFSGWVLFMVSSCLLFLIGRILAWLPPKGSKVEQTTVSCGEKSTNQAIGVPYIDGAFITSMIILILVAGLSFSTKALPPIKLTGGIASFPLMFSNWSGQATLVDPEIIDKSGAEEAFNGNYQNSAGDDVSLYIGYRGTAFLANENFFHSPTVCLPSSGWETIETSTHEIQGVPFFGRLKVTKMIVAHMDSKMVVYFWFQTKNKATYDKNINRFDLALHAIRRDNTHDLFIRTITPIRLGESIRVNEQRMDVFVTDMMSALLTFIKEHQIVNSALVK